jgi:hypothetical protein
MRKILRSPKFRKIVDFVFLGLFVLFFFAKDYLPDANDDGWSEPPLIDYLLLLGFGICIATIGTLYTYNSWVLDTKHYLRWIDQSSFIRPPKLKLWKSKFSDYDAQWLMRLIAPFFILCGITISIVMIANIIDFFFG